jgi:hypothetical protein
MLAYKVANSYVIDHYILNMPFLNKNILILSLNMPILNKHFFILRDLGDCCMAAPSGAHSLEVRREREAGYPDFPLPNQIYHNPMFGAGVSASAMGRRYTGNSLLASLMCSH